MHLVTQNTPKKQHYVPQFLLRNFTGDNTDRIFTFDKQQKRIFATTVKDSASENGFYNMQIAGNKYTLENELGDLESLASRVISKICLSESVADLEENEHKVLCFFTANLLLRVKRQRVFTSQMNIGIAESMKGLGLEPNSFSNFKELTKDEVEFQHINFLKYSVLEFANIFGDKAIGLLRAPKNSSFIISDNPVVMFCHKPDRFKSKGVSVPAIEIFLPISKSLCLTFLCMDFFHELIEKINIIKHYKATHPQLEQIDISYINPLIESIITGDAHTIDTKHLNFINRRQIVDSWMYIYNECDDFYFAKELLKKHPTINSPNLIKFGFD